MLFDTTLFVWFFLIVFAGFWAMVKYPIARVIWLLLASYVFYASWNPALLSLILFSTVLDYFAGRGIYRAESKKVRKLWLMASLVGNLGMLSLFKYADFFISSINRAVELTGGSGTIPLMELVLPVGISFYTFQTLSYTIDIYRGKLEAVDNPLHFALFVAFFPQLVAGPIVRASNFLPQLLRDPRYDSRKHGVGLFLILSGLIKKVAIANVLAINFVDRIYDNPLGYSSLEVLTGLYGYSLQIYCDFSGYSDVAIGLALLLGFQLPINFDRPYMSGSIAEYWRRWHISLSTWLRDYLYIPLGGNRKGEFNTYRNLFITMLLGGLWHGAGWNFVIWGALHGVALAGTRLWQKMRADSRGKDWKPSSLYRFVTIFLTFHFVTFAFILFRSPTFEVAQTVTNRLLEFTTYVPNIGWIVLAALGAGYLMHFTPQRWKYDLQEVWVKLPAAAQAAVMLTVAIALQQIKGSAVVPFIYFQF
jgi:D-alanyl-lipoteichoic acid acyltransferase DltB (MBOAT superfamily)